MVNSWGCISLWYQQYTYEKDLHKTENAGKVLKLLYNINNKWNLWHNLTHRRFSFQNRPTPPLRDKALYSKWTIEREITTIYLHTGTSTTFGLLQNVHLEACWQVIAKNLNPHFYYWRSNGSRTPLFCLLLLLPLLLLLLLFFFASVFLFFFFSLCSYQKP